MARFHNRNLIHAAASQIEAIVRRRDHVPHYTAAGGNRPGLELLKISCIKPWAAPVR
jgi:hypothetical protein